MEIAELEETLRKGKLPGIKGDLALLTTKERD